MSFEITTDAKSIQHNKTYYIYSVSTNVWQGLIIATDKVLTTLTYNKILDLISLFIPTKNGFILYSFIYLYDALGSDILNQAFTEE